MCIGCGVCVAFCEVDAVAIGYGYTALIFPDACNGCGVCAEECDMNAMSIAARPASLHPTLL